MDLIALIEMLRRYLVGVWRYRLLGVCTAWAVCLAGWFFAYSLPNQYEASTRVFVDTQNVLRPLLSGLFVETDVLDDVAIMTRVLTSKPQLEKVARESDLDLGATSGRQMENLINSLRSRIQVGGSRENIYTLSFADNQRDVALTVIRNLLDIFVEDTLGSGTDDSDQAERTLKQQINEYEIRLIDAEERLSRFKRQNVGMMPDERGDYYSQMQAEMAVVSELEGKLRVAQRRRAELQRQLSGERPVFGIVSGSGQQASATDQEIHALTERRAKLLTEFTERHPEVRRIDSRLDELRNARPEQNAFASPGEQVTELDYNPVYQQMKIQLSEQEVKIAGFRAQLGDQKNEVDRLKKLVDVIPQVEAELNSLNRDYSVVKARYEQMLSRWEDLQTGKLVRRSADSVQFRVIEPPFAATDPVGPPRLLFIIAAFVLALGAGGAVAVLFDLLNPVFVTADDLERLGYPIIGQVSMAGQTTSRASWQHASVTVIALIGLSATLVAVLVFADNGSSLLRSVL